MKRLISYLSSAGFLLAVIMVIGETSTTTKTPLPEKLGAVYLAKDGKLLELERQVAKIKSKGGAGSFFSSLATGGIYSTKMKIAFIIKDSSSPVRMEGARPTFAVRVMPGFDPKSMHLIPFKSKKKERQSITAEAGGWLGLQSSSEQGYPSVPTDAVPSKEDPQVIYLTPAVDLIPGEYAFSATNSQDGYCFGVDKPTESGTVQQSTMAEKGRK